MGYEITSVTSTTIMIDDAIQNLLPSGLCQKELIIYSLCRLMVVIKNIGALIVGLVQVVAVAVAVVAVAVEFVSNQAA